MLVLVWEPVTMGFSNRSEVLVQLVAHYVAAFLGK